MHEDRTPYMTRRRYLQGMVGIGVAGVAGTVIAKLPTSLAASTLTWQAPTDGDTVGGNVTLQVDPPSGTTRVLFYVNDNWVGAAKSAPWQIELDTSAYSDGEYTLRANARDDNSGSLLDRQDINVIFDQSAGEDSQDDGEDAEPDGDALTWLNPQEGDQISGVTTLEVQPPGSTTRVLFYVNDNWVGAAHSGPWQFDLDTTAYSDGDISLRANARDDNADTLLDEKYITVTVAQGAAEEPNEDEDDQGDEDDSHDNPGGEEAVSGQACPLWVHDSYEGAWHPPVDPQYGCYIGHEHGDHPDPDGFFADAGVEPINLNHLLEIYEAHLANYGRTLDDLPWHTEQYKVQYLDPGDRQSVGRHQFVNINDNAMAAWGEPRYINERNSDYEWASYIPVRANLLGPNGTYIDVRWVCKIGDVHNRSRAIDPFDKEDFVELHEDNPQEARDFLSSGNRGIAFYMTPFTNDRKRGHHFVQVDGKDLFRYAFFYRMMDSSVYSTGSMKNAYASDDPDAEGNWHLGSMRWTSRMSMGAFVEPGIYWTDVYGEKLLGRGENPPNTNEFAIKQVVGFRSGMRHYVHESKPGKAMVAGSLARLYDAPGLRFPT